LTQSNVVQLIQVQADPDMVIRLHALNRYARKGEFISDSWGTVNFKKTFQAAFELCKDVVDSTYGFEIRWYPGPRNGDHISCSSEGKKFYRDLQLTGPVAAALLEELSNLAEAVAIAEIKREEEDARRVQARARLSMIMDVALASSTKPKD
jgi:hypothetical protein